MSTYSKNNSQTLATKFTGFHVSLDLHQGASIEDPLFEGVQEDGLHLVLTCSDYSQSSTELENWTILGCHEFSYWETHIESWGSPSRVDGSDPGSGKAWKRMPGPCLSLSKVNVQFGMLHQILKVVKVQTLFKHFVGEGRCTAIWMD